MALISLLALAGGTLAMAFLFAALGHQILKAIRFEAPSNAEQILCSVATGTVTAELLIFLAAATNRIRPGLVLAFLLALMIAFAEFAQVYKRCSIELRKIAHASSFEKLLAGFAALLVAIESLSAMAPLTSSDALHYHFAAQQHIVRYTRIFF